MGDSASAARRHLCSRTASTRELQARANMLSGVVQPLLEKSLGKWIKLEQGQLDTSGGKIRLRRVEIREDAWDELALPVALRGGLIEEVEIDIPWTKLKTESVVVKLHSPVLLLAPHSEGEWDSAMEAKRAAARKQHELQKLRDAAAPVTANAATSAPIEDSGEKGFLEKLIARAIDNAQILITSALIRFEDYSHADEPFGLEVAFDSLWIHPEHVKAPVPGGGAAAGAGGKEEKERPLAHREALVCALCAYILDSTSLPPTPQTKPCASASELESRLSSTGLPLGSPAALRANARRCCLAPLSLAAELASRRIDEPSLPQHVCCIETGRMHIELSQAELTRLAASFACLSNFERLDVRRSFRPPLHQRPSNAPRAWWHFAMRAIRYELQTAKQP